MADPKAMFPLDGVSDVPAIGLEARNGVTKVIVRGDPSEVAGAFEKAAEVKWPTEPNTTVSGGNRTALWLGPNEVMVHDSGGEPEALCAALEKALADHHAAVVDVSDYYDVLRISGARARETLEHECPFDFHPKAFPEGRCAQTRFAKAAVLVHHAAPDSTYDIQVRRSFAEYLYTLLSGIAEELAD